ncbi:hypothetical protein ACFFX0_24660 [Citricoccus parietis]|uniref:Uncharacterized protein n=1 Tax=Citricoccus parietis TaxID=592307 RepID=A0ABV5G5H6_9MICC
MARRNRLRHVGRAETLTHCAPDAPGFTVHGAGGRSPGPGAGSSPTAGRR